MAAGIPHAPQPGSSGPLGPGPSSVALTTTQGQEETSLPQEGERGKHARFLSEGGQRSFFLGHSGFAHSVRPWEDVSLSRRNPRAEPRRLKAPSSSLSDRLRGRPVIFVVRRRDPTAETSLG